MKRPKEKINIIPYILSAVLIGILYYFYSVSYDYSFGRTLSHTLAYGSIVFIGLSLVLGPISHILQKDFSEYRKDFGLLGFGVAFLHILLSFRYSVGWSFVFGLLALITFFIAASTSNNWAFKRLGFDRWRSIQRLSYLAFFLAILHFIFIPNLTFIKTIHGQVLLTFSLFVILVKILMIFARKNEISFR